MNFCRNRRHDVFASIVTKPHFLYFIRIFCLRPEIFCVRIFEIYIVRDKICAVILLSFCTRRNFVSLQILSWLVFEAKSTMRPNLPIKRIFRCIDNIEIFWIFFVFFIIFIQHHGNISERCLTICVA